MKLISIDLLRFIWFVSKRVAFAKGKEKNVSHFVVRIGQIAVGLGVAISLITISVGVGSQITIKNKLAAFSGHYVLKSFDSNNSYNSSPLKTNHIQWKSLQNFPSIQHIQKFATLSGVIRTSETFEGVVFKGYGKDFQKENFSQILTSGNLPDFSKIEASNETLISEKIARELKLKPKDFYQIYFINPSGRPIYRKFQVSGIYRTDVKLIDASYVIGDIRQIQRINKWNNGEIGGLEIFLKNPDDIDATHEAISSFCGYDNRLEKMTDSFASITHWVDLFDMNILIIIVIMSIVVAMNLIMVFLILVIEKVRFIGVMKTLGATDNSLRALFISYSLWIMLPGIIGGNLLALVLLIAQKHLGFITLDPENYYMSVVPVYLHWDFPLMVSIGTWLIALIVLALPSVVIAKIPPAKLLKFD